MARLPVRIVALLLAWLPFALAPRVHPAPAVSATILISEVQVRGALSPSDEFIELYNAGDAPFDLNGHRLLYRTAAGTTDLPRYEWRASTIVPPYHHYLLVREGADGYDGPVVGNATFSQGIGDDGGLALVDPAGRIVDAVGWGSASNIFVEGAPAPRPGPEQSIERLPGGNAGNGVDTNHNASDFVLRPIPEPQNLASLPTCPTCPTATPTPTPSHTPSPTASRTPSPTRTPTPSRTFTPSATPSPTVTPSPTSFPAGAIVIHEVAYDPPAPGNDAAYEWFELQNRTDHPVSLAGWAIADNAARDALPAIVLPPGGFVVIAARVANFMEDHPNFAGIVAEIAGGRIGNGLANTGDRLLLYDPSGAQVDALSYGSDASVFNPPARAVPEGHSLEREPGMPDTDTAADFVDRFPPSPGGAPPPMPLGGTIEGWVFIDHNGNGLREPWLGERAGIDGVLITLFLPDRTTRVKTTAGGGFYVFTNISASGTYTIVESQPPGYTSTSPDVLIVRPTPGRRHIDNNFGEKVSTPTPSPTAAPPPTPYPPAALVIHEVLYDALAPGNDAAYEWFELQNRTGHPVSLAGWAVADNVARDDLPPIVLPPGGFAVIAARRANFLEDNPDFTGLLGELADGRIGNGLANEGDRLLLYDPLGNLIDALSYGSDTSVFNPSAPLVPPGHSLEREPNAPDTDTAADFVERALPSPGHMPLPTPTATATATATPTASPTATLMATPSPTFTPTRTPRPTHTPTPTRTATATATPTASPTATPTVVPAPAVPLLISEVVYDGLDPGGEGDEFVEIWNPLTIPVSLEGYKIGDEETPGGNEGMYIFPTGAHLVGGQAIVIAKNALAFRSRFGRDPDYELALSGPDAPEVPNLIRYTSWGRGHWSLANQGDEVILLGPRDERIDAIAYGEGDFAAVSLTGRLLAPAPRSGQRVADWDHDDMRADFAVDAPTPGKPLQVPAPVYRPPAPLPGGMFAYHGALRAQSNYAGGLGPAPYAWAVARAHGLHFLALSERDAALDSLTWRALGEQAQAATVPGAFVALRAFEIGPRDRPHLSVYGTDGYLAPQDAPTGWRSWLLAHAEASVLFVAPDPGRPGDPYFLPFDPDIASRWVGLEIGHGAGAEHRRYEGAYRRALAEGWRLAPVGNPDDGYAWGARSSLRTGLVAPALTQEDLLEALRARRVFATEDANLALALRAGDIWMGSEVSPTESLTLVISFFDPEAETLTLEVYDRDVLLASRDFTGQVSVLWQVNTVGLAGHYYFVRARQADGDLAYTAPIWVAGEAVPDDVFLNEVLPSPRHVDWDGNGQADADDEWVELYNPGPVAVSLGGWTLSDASGKSPYTIPAGTTIAARGFRVLFRRETRLALNTSAETITLRRPDGSVADAFHYDRFIGWDQSWSRTVDGGGVWTSEYEVTPGGPNYPRPTPTPRPPPSFVSIAKARALPEGATVIVEGQVTAPPPYFGRSIYVQDATGGINVYLTRGEWPDLSEGERLRITGRLEDLRGERQLRLADPSALTRLGPAQPLRPARVRTGHIDEAHEGLLVMIVGKVVELQTDAVILDDGSGPARVYVRESTGWRRPRMQRGEIWAAVGVVSQYGRERPYTDGYRLLPRYPDDLAPPPAHLPETGASAPMSP